MDSKLIFGIGMALLSLFLRWRFPSVPKPLATAGAAIGVALIVWSQFLKFPPLYAAGAIMGVAIAAAITDWLINKRMAEGPGTPAPAPVADQRVTSHNQSGGITAHQVDTGNDGQKR